MSDNESVGEDTGPQVDYDEIGEDGFKVVEKEIYEAYQKALQQAKLEQEEDAEEEVKLDYDSWEEEPEYSENVMKYVITYGIYSGEVDSENGRNGEGTTWYPNGDIFKGSYVDDGKKDGEGLYIYKSQGKSPQDELIESIAKADKAPARLVQAIEDESWEKAGIIASEIAAKDHKVNVQPEQAALVLQFGPYPFYNGKFMKNEMVGEGLRKYKDGSIYRGEFSANERHGFGKMKYNNGDEYAGDWSNGKKHGEGSYFFKQLNHAKYVGKWENGNIISGEWIMSNGIVYNGNFEDNVPDGEGSFNFGSAQLKGQFYAEKWIPNAK
eukprot:CAMPEP_0117425090 /NCGR_PEP_ID=MMETSP0758-20121206/5405_1 /TAXON_ID=63605 /ORGANISM="Percolomonas cosmopolitus, Strain AE-1 (ATCC 50343)" /LENGTH=323 /DNA_ID=CAMNT_0005209313 /DNA_START=19 /DNA_END=987 /DNA_ORIENTATION=+